MRSPDYHKNDNFILTGNIRFRYRTVKTGWFSSESVLVVQVEERYTYRWFPSALDSTPQVVETRVHWRDLDWTDLLKSQFSWLREHVPDNVPSLSHLTSNN